MVMDNSEAIKILQQIGKSNIVSNESDYEEINVLYTQAINRAIEALEKQMPKHIIEDRCPNCGASAIKEYESKYDYICYNYCDNCGQNLDYDI